MGTSQEVKDFLSGFTGGFKMMDDSLYKQALSEYYRNGKRGGGGNKGILGYAVDDEPKPGIFGWLSGDKKDERSDAEIGADKLLRAEQEAIRAGRPDDVEKIRSMQKLHVKQNQPAAPPAASQPAAPVKPAPEPEPNPPTVGPNEGRPVRGIRGSALGGGMTVADASDDMEDLEDDEDGGVVMANVGFSGGMMRKALPPAAIPAEPPPVNPVIEKGPLDESEATSVDTEDEEASYDEDADFDLSLKLEQAAVPGLAAGLKLIQQRVATPQTAVSDGTPEDESGAQALARNDGAAKPDEVRAIDQIIDPEGKMPPQAKSAARISAVWEYYSSKGQPDKAAELIQSLMLYDRKNAQTRGALAVQAFQEGRNDEGVRLIQDANNNDTPGATLIQKAVYNPDDQTVTATVRDEDGKRDVKLPIQQVAAEAQNIASGKSSFDRLVETVGKRTAPGTSNDKAITQELFQAQVNLQRAQRTNDQKQIAAARSNLDAVEDKILERASKMGPREGSALLKRLGVNPSREVKPPAQPKTQGRTPQPTEKERAELAKKQEVRDLNNKYEDQLYNAYSLAQAGIKVDDEGNATEAVPAGPGGRRSEVAAEAQARETQRPEMERMGGRYNVERSGLAYKQAPELKQYVEQPFNDRTEQIAQEIKGLVAAKSQGKKEPIMTEPEQRQLRREVDRLAQKNNIDHGELVEFLYNAKYNIANREPLKFDSKTGMVQMGRTKVFVDEDMLRDIAKNVGERARRAEGMASEMNAKDIETYKRGTARMRDRDEREAANKQRAQQAVDDTTPPTVGGETPRARAESGRRFTETQKRTEQLRQAIPSYPDPTPRPYTDEERDAIARQRRRWSYPYGK